MENNAGFIKGKYVAIGKDVFGWSRHLAKKFIENRGGYVTSGGNADFGIVRGYAIGDEAPKSWRNKSLTIFDDVAFMEYVMGRITLADLHRGRRSTSSPPVRAMPEIACPPPSAFSLGF